MIMKDCCKDKSLYIDISSLLKKNNVINYDFEKKKIVWTMAKRSFLKMIVKRLVNKFKRGFYAS